MTDLAFSLPVCASENQEPQMVVSVKESCEEQGVSVVSDVSEHSDIPDTASGYTILVRDFHGWITVTAECLYHAAWRVVLNAVRAFCRVIREVKAVFNQRAFVRLEGLRL